jgi:hypothetical protein
MGEPWAQLAFATASSIDRARTARSYGDSCYSCLSVINVIRVLGLVVRSLAPTVISLVFREECS